MQSLFGFRITLSAILVRIPVSLGEMESFLLMCRDKTFLFGKVEGKEKQCI